MKAWILAAVLFGLATGPAHAVESTDECGVEGRGANEQAAARVEQELRARKRSRLVVGAAASQEALRPPLVEARRRGEGRGEGGGPIRGIPDALLIEGRGAL